MNNTSRNALSTKIYKELLSHNVSEFTSLCRAERELVVNHVSYLFQSKVHFSKRLIFSERSELDKLKAALFSPPILPKNAVFLDVDKLVGGHEIESNTLKFNWINKIASGNIFNVSIDKKTIKTSNLDDRYSDVFTLFSQLGKKIDLNTLSKTLFSTTLTVQDKSLLKSLGVESNRLPITIEDMVEISCTAGFYPILCVSSTNWKKASILSYFTKHQEGKLPCAAFIEFSESSFEDIASGFISAIPIANQNFCKFNPYSDVVDLRKCIALKSNGKHQVSLLSELEKIAISNVDISDDIKDKIQQFIQGFFEFIEKENGSDYNYILEKGKHCEYHAILVNALFSYLDGTSRLEDIYYYLQVYIFSEECQLLKNQLSSKHNEILKNSYKDDESDFDIFSDEIDYNDDSLELCMDDDLFGDDNGTDDLFYDENESEYEDKIHDKSNIQGKSLSDTNKNEKNRGESNVSFDTVFAASFFLLATWVVVSTIF